MTAFVACPACGGPVHPIAGRCKHCKADLVRLREQHAQAVRAASMGMPARPAPGAPLLGPPAPVMAPQPAHRAPTPAPLPAAGGYAPGYGTALGSGWSRRWPLLVGGAAILVIAVSLVILFSNKADGSTGATTPGTSRSPRPIPDDMNQPRGPLGLNVPEPPEPPVDPGRDPGLGFPPRSPGQRSDPTDATSFAAALIETMCNRLQSCGVVDDSTRMMCSQAGALMDPGALGGSGPQCTINPTAVSACFDAIESISCDAVRSGDIFKLLGGSSSIGECANACI